MQADPPLAKGAPPVAGGIAWARSLLARVQRTMHSLQTGHATLLEASFGQMVGLASVSWVSAMWCRVLFWTCASFEVPAMHLCLPPPATAGLPVRHWNVKPSISVQAMLHAFAHDMPSVQLQVAIASCTACCARSCVRNLNAQTSLFYTVGGLIHATHALTRDKIKIQAGAVLQVTSQYRGLARQIMGYEQSRFEAWRGSIDASVVSMLRHTPLTTDAAGR